MNNHPQYYNKFLLIKILIDNYIVMSNNDNLLTFLKKNSLFNSPSKNGTRKSKSRSKDKGDSRVTPTRNKETFFEDQYRNKPFSQPGEYSFGGPLEPTRGPAPVQVNNGKVGNTIPESRFNGFEELEDRRENRGIMQVKPNNEIWTGLVSYTASFQSARIESTHCLDTLSSKVRNEIANINIKVETFNSRMYKVITDEFKNLRERVMFIIDQSFKESEKYIREYMKTQEEKLAGDLIKMKDSLQKEFNKIEGMKEEIGKPNWRKVAGEIIASELERKVDELVKQSSQLSVGRWELGDLVGYRLKDLERDLREVVRLKREA